VDEWRVDNVGPSERSDAGDGSKGRDGEDSSDPGDVVWMSGSREVSVGNVSSSIGSSVNDDFDCGRSIELFTESDRTGGEVASSGALVGEGNRGIEGGGGGCLGKENASEGSSGNEENAEAMSAIGESTASACV
jgi:hypothetical protein